MATPITLHAKRDLLSTLPPELREEVFAFATYHSEGDGVICPVSDIPGVVNYVVMDDERWRVKDGELFLGPIAAGATEEDIEVDYGRVNDFPLVTMKHGEHLCTLDCLLQPGITRVSSLYREEALPIFYKENKFHFEFGQFETMQWTCDSHRQTIEMFYGIPPVMHERPLYYPSYGFDLPYRGENGAFRGFEQTIGRSPVDWWRGVGDSNLKMIKKMTLVLPSVSPLQGGIDACIEVEISKGGKSVEMADEHYSIRGMSILPNDCHITSRLFDKQGDRERYHISKRMRYRGDLDEDFGPAVEPYALELHKGINIMGLERLLAFFEPDLAYWLRDDEYLVGDSWNVFVLKRVLGIGAV